MPLSNPSPGLSGAPSPVPARLSRSADLWSLWSEPRPLPRLLAGVSAMRLRRSARLVPAESEQPPPRRSPIGGPA